MPNALPPFDEIEETLALFDDWEDRYRYIIDLGRDLSPMDDALKNPQTKVRGCSSQVWLVAGVDANPPHDMSLMGDSDAHIVKGLVAILLALYKGKTPAEAATLDAKAALDRLQLAEHLSPTRTNGLFSMVARIGELAQAHLAAAS